MSGTNPRYLVSKRSHINGPPIPDDEPVIIIRAQDILAPEMLTDYLARYITLEPEHVDPAVVMELLEHQQRLFAWQNANIDKLKYADR